MRALIDSFRNARRDHPWLVPGVALSASAALGSHLSELLAVAQRVLP